jgi:3-hydroxyacyl-CoA dehydrogenase
MKDLAGNDVMWRIRQQQGMTSGQASDRKPNARWDSKFPRYCTLPDKLCEAGYFGQKTGRGWYKYDSANPRKPVEDEETRKFVEDHRRDVVLFASQYAASETDVVHLGDFAKDYSRSRDN